MSISTKPDIENIGAEVDFKIWNYTLYDSAENLFNKLATPAQPPYNGTATRRDTSYTMWFNTSNFLDIEFLDDVNIWDSGSHLEDRINELTVYVSNNGSRGDFVSKLSKNNYAGVSPFENPNWKMIGTIKKGRYLIFNEDGYRISFRWYLEKSTTNKTLILHDSEYKKFIEKIDGFNSEQVETSTYFNEMTSNEDNKVSISLPTGGANLTNLPYYIFNKSLDYWYASGANNKVGFILQMKNPVAIGKIGITTTYPISGSNYGIKDFSFLGSKDGINYVNLITGMHPNGPQTSVKYALSNIDIYTYYKFESNSYYSLGTILINYFELFKANGGIVSSPAKWETISTTHPTKTQFETDGMENISPLFDRVATKLEPVEMIDKSEIISVGGDGKVFIGSINLRKNLNIKGAKIEVK